jgi:hypothetical protein
MKDKQTAVEWLVKELNNLHPDLILSLKIWDDIDNLINQAKQMEKEQIIDARANGFMSSAEGWNGEIPCMKWSELVRETKCEEYYNETYGK